MFPNKLAPNKAPYNIPKDPPFCHFLSFLIVLATPFNKSLESSRTWTIFIMSLVSSFQIISFVVPKLFIFFLISASIAAAAVLLTELKYPLPIELLLSLMVLLFYLMMFLKKPYGIILDICVLHNFVSADKLFSNVFLSLAFDSVVNNNSWGKLFPSKVLIFTLRFTSVLFLAPEF